MGYSIAHSGDNRGSPTDGHAAAGSGVCLSPTRARVGPPKELPRFDEDRSDRGLQPVEAPDNQARDL